MERAEPLASDWIYTGTNGIFFITDLLMLWLPKLRRNHLNMTLPVWTAWRASAHRKLISKKKFLFVV